jgi:hypothetical protein
LLAREQGDAFPQFVARVGEQRELERFAFLLAYA